LAPRLSRYSEHYRDLDEIQATRALESLQSRLEDFRLRLDLERILPWIKGPDVLDFPIGTGRFYPNLTERFQVHGYDIAQRYIERARMLHPEIADRFKVCTLEQPDQSEQFDTVVTLRTLNNIGDTAAAIRGVASILKSGARWIFVYPPVGVNFQSLTQMLNDHGLHVIERQRYDLHGGARSSRIGAALYGRYLRLIEAGLVPYFAYKTVDRIFAKHGTELFVAEKRS
jgi:2-polyprenyl-3-methyl-5-hydroxy-6-metoxy-1,4-benzoquinol methylase